MSKLYNKNPQIGFMETTNALLHGNKKIANTYWPDLGLGEIKEGGVADLIMIDYHAPTPLTSDTFLGHLVFGISQERVHTTIASGKILMENYQLTTIDEAKIMADARQKTEAIWTKFRK
jgi:cytosine/adenosine deaminase-related metal-dependent hydrolase